MLKRAHPKLGVTKGSLERWSHIHDWAKRVKAHDSAMQQGRVQVLTPAILSSNLDPDFDQVDAPLQAANQTRPRMWHVEALVDAAAHALKLVEMPPPA